jgi:hypothetical protein
MNNKSVKPITSQKLTMGSSIGNNDFRRWILFNYKILPIIAFHCNNEITQKIEEVLGSSSKTINLKVIPRSY